METTYPLLANRLVYIIKGGGGSSSYLVRASETDMLPGFLSQKIDSTLQIRDNKMGVSGNVFDNFNSAVARIELTQQGLKSQFSDFSDQYQTFSSSFEQTAKGFAMAVYSQEIDKFSGEISEKYSTREHTADAIRDLVSNTTLDEYRNVISETYSTREQTATLISDKVYEAVFDPSTGVRSEMMSAINQTADNIEMYVEGSLYGPNGIESAYLSEIEIAKGLIRSEVSETLYGEDGEGGIVAEYRTGISQTSRDITLAVEEITELGSKAANLEMAVDKITLGLFEDGVLSAGMIISALNNGETEARIKADRIQIDGTTTFAPGYNPYEIAQDIDELEQGFIGLDENFSNFSEDVLDDINTFNSDLLDRISEMGNRKNTRYVSATQPTLPEGGFRIGDEWVKEIEVIPEEDDEEDEEDEEISYVYESYMWMGNSWEPNVTVIDGGRITTGVIDAARISAKELFSQEIGAVKLNVAEGFIGGFTINNMLIAEDSEGRGISIDPKNQSVWIKSLEEGAGLSQTIMRAGPLTPVALLKTVGGVAYVSSSPTGRVDIRKPGGVELNHYDNYDGTTVIKYIGKVGSSPFLSDGKPTNSQVFSLEKNKNFTADMPFAFTIVHNKGVRKGNTHNIAGSLKVTVYSTLIGVRDDGGETVLVEREGGSIDITRNTNSTEDFTRGMMRKASFHSKECTKAYWKLELYFKGDLRYQARRTSGGRHWGERKDMGFDYKGHIPVGLSFSPSIGIMEITTTGLQFMWSNDRMFRVSGNDTSTFIQSKGRWIHDGELIMGEHRIATSNDLGMYALTSYVDEGFYNKNESDGKYALKGGSSTQDFTVKNLIVHGQVDHYVGQTLVVDDARIRLNRKNGAATVASGIDVANGVDVVSSLDYSLNGVWTLGGQQIFTDAYNPKLGGHLAAKYPRRDVIENISERWWFNGGINVKVRTLYQDSSGATVGDISPMSDYGGKTALVINANYSSNILGFQTSAGYNNRTTMDELGNWNMAKNITAQGNLDVTGISTLRGEVILSDKLRVAKESFFADKIQASNAVSQSTGWQITKDGIADFRHIYVDEMQAKAFTADISQALVGSDILTKSVAKLAETWTTTANNITSSIFVEELEGFSGYQVFEVGDYLLLRLFDRTGGGLLIKNIWATVSSYVGTVKNVQEYKIKVVSGGLANHSIYKGSMALDYGKSGSGVIERTVLDQLGSPYSQVRTWTGTPYGGNFTTHYRSGNLNGIANCDGWGMYSENSFLTGKLVVGDLTKSANGHHLSYESGVLTLQGKIIVKGTGSNVATSEDLENLEIGGRNLAEGTNQGAKNWAWGMQVGGYTATEHIEDGVSCCKLTRDSTPHSGWNYGMYSKIGRDKLEGGATYMISLDVFTNKTSTLSLYFRAGNNQYELISKWDYKNNTCTANSWSRVVLKATLLQTLPPETNQVLYIAGLNIDTNAYYIFRNLKIAKGNKATDWTPAPEDVDSKLDALFGGKYSRNETIIEGGKLVTGLIDVEHIEGLTLDFTKGTIGGIKIDNSKIWTNNWELNKDGSAKFTNSLTVGNINGQYLRYLNGQLEIKGKISVTGGNVATKEDLDDLEIGGKNLALGTNQGSKNWAWPTQTAGATTVTSVLENGVETCKMVRGSGSIGAWQYIMYGAIQPTLWLPNTDYVVSFYVKSNVVTTFTARVIVSSLRDQFTNVATADKATVVNTWTKITFSLKTLAALPVAGNQVLYLTANSEAGTSYQFKNLMVEKGVKATDWSPNPGDVESKLDALFGGKYSRNETIIEGGKLVTGLIDAEQINALNVNFTKGRIGGFDIGGTYLMTDNLIISRRGLTFRDGNSNPLGYIESTSDQVRFMSVGGSYVTLKNTLQLYGTRDATLTAGGTLRLVAGEGIVMSGLPLVTGTIPSSIPVGGLYVYASSSSSKTGILSIRLK